MRSLLLAIALHFLECCQSVTFAGRDVYKPYGVLMCRHISKLSNSSFTFHEEDLSCKRENLTNKEIPKRKSEEGPCINVDGIRPDYKSYKREKTRIYVKFYHINKTWNEAQAMCEQEKATLLIMNTRAIRTIFSAELVSMRMTAKGVNPWIGLSRANLSAPWTWSDGRQVTERIYWSYDQAIEALKTPKYKCVMGVTICDRQRSYESPCGELHYFICQCLVNENAWYQ